MKNKTILSAIGNTSHIKIDGIDVKLEFENPSGSIKDRLAKYVIEKAERTGKLKKGNIVVEASSGNSAIAFAMVCTIKGYKMHTVMPKAFSHERTRLLRAFGSKLTYTKRSKNLLKEACEIEEKLGKKKNYFAVKQFDTPWNVEAYQKTLGKEMTKELGKIDCFVAGVGTGGTLIGVGKALMKINPKVKLIAVEPEEAPVLAGGDPAHHSIEGIGDGFIPGIIEKNKKMIHKIIHISSDDAIEATRMLAKKHGILGGVSSGANLLAALKMKKKFKKVATVFPDKGERYLSMNFY